jgi:hypothetical protein
MKEYKKNELVKMLKLMKKVSTGNYDITQKIHDLYIDKKIELISLEVNDAFDFKYRFDSDDEAYLNYSNQGITKWVTYENCIHNEFYLDESNNLIFKITVYSGDSYGEESGVRFTATFKLNISFFAIISNVIENNFNDYLELEYEKKLQKEKELWMCKEADKLLGKELVFIGLS